MEWVQQVRFSVFESNAVHQYDVYDLMQPGVVARNIATAPSCRWQTIAVSNSATQRYPEMAFDPEIMTIVSCHPKC